jgi:hypothetical protein
MKPTLPLAFLLLAGTTLHAQFSLLPYAGFEQSRNSLRYSNGLVACDMNGNLKAGLRMDYRLKGGHSPFINVTTNPAPLRFSFDRVGALLDNVAATRGNQQLRLEAGYQFSSRPIRLGKKSVAPSQPAFEPSEITTMRRSGCGSMAKKAHGSNRNRAFKMAQPNRSLNMRLQPSLALAYIPSETETVKQTANGFEYATGAWRTAVVPAMGFEFARGSQRLFTLTAFYTQPLRQGKEVVTTQMESKIIASTLQPRAASWGLTLGVPFSFGKSTASKVKTRTEKKSCTKTYYRKCMRL